MDNIAFSKLRPSDRRVGLVCVAGHHSTALGPKQHGFESVADLAGEQAERIRLGSIDVRRESGADIGAAELCPVVQAFNAVDHIERLPAIANLATDSAGGHTMAAFGSNACEIPAVMARAPAAVNAI